MSRLDYLAVGHVTIDVIVDASCGLSRQPGGSAFYSALQAARLGLNALILTKGEPAELAELLSPYRGELQTRIIPSRQTTTLLTHGSGESRRQSLLAWAGQIAPADPGAFSPRILHLAPVARELQGDHGLRAPFVALTPQGLLRSWETQGELAPSELDVQALPRRCDAIVLSAKERELCDALFEADAGELRPLTCGARASQGPVIAVTAGPGAVTLRLPSGSTALLTPPPVETVRDDLGAGDVFAAAFFIALAEGSPAERAAAFGCAAAAVRIEGCGPHAIGDRARIEALLSRR